jgi:hypothetical protein
MHPVKVKAATAANKVLRARIDVLIAFLLPGHLGGVTLNAE